MIIVQRAIQKNFRPLFADQMQHMKKSFNIDVSDFKPMVSRPGEPHDTVNVSEVTAEKSIRHLSEAALTAE